ncbi:MAG: FAD-binding oxidoreductase [Solirubrobacteraceae bacterium]
MLIIEKAGLDVVALRERIAGDVVVPGDGGWDAARAAWNLAVDQRPAAVVLPESAGDVVAAVEAARDGGLRVAAQGTGHNAGPLGDLSDTVLVKTERMRGVTVDPEARRVRVEAGVTWGEVVGRVQEHGLAALAGSSHDVGVVGYTLGGGLSWLARSKGMSANSVHAIEIVLADGRLVRTDAAHEPDLFWALRGGGGSFGVVTAIELELYEIPEVYAGMLVFGWERSAEVLHAWREWTETVPDEVTSVGRILQVPPLPEIPEVVRGRRLAVVEVIYTGDAQRGDALVAPLRALGAEIDTIHTIPTAELITLHMDPPGPVPGKGDGGMLETVTPETIDALVAAAGPESGSPLLSVELRHMGGAVGRPSPEHGAANVLEGDYVMFAVGMALTPEMTAAVETHVDVVKDALAPWDAGKRYLNFAERPIDARSAYASGAYARLRAVKTLVDPEDFFRANHPIEPIR